MSRHHSAVWPALVFEGALGVVAVLLAALLGWPSPMRAPAPTPRPVAAQLLLGIGAATPLILAFLVLERRPLGRFSEVRRAAAQMATRLFRGATLAELALVSALAGLGEELFFRGLLIGSLARGTGIGVPAALLLSSVLFGLAHPISRSYAVAAGVVGLYLSAIYLWSGGVLAPIIAHAVYDFVALWRLLRQGPGDEPGAGGDDLHETETPRRQHAEEQ